MPFSDPEKEKAYKKKYREDHKEELKAQQKIYQQSPAGKKSNRIRNWKCSGIICDDFDTLYERYLNTELCELCDVELTEDKRNTKTTRCLDHCHETREVRNIVCNSCNAKLPRQ